VLNSVGFTLAQEGTQEAVVVVPTEGAVIEIPADEVVPAGNPSEVSVNLVNVIIGLLTAFAAGGIVGIAGLAIFIDRIRKDTATVTAMEKLADSFPASTKQILERAFTVLEKASNLGVEVFDATPILEKPQEGS
jgi:hypothetical protein